MLVSGLVEGVAVVVPAFKQVAVGADEIDHEHADSIGSRANRVSRIHDDDDDYGVVAAGIGVVAIRGAPNISLPITSA